MKTFVILGVVLAAVLVVAYVRKDKGPMEKAGERVDEIVDNIGKGEPPLQENGLLEKAGRAVYKAIEGPR